MYQATSLLVVVACVFAVIQVSLTQQRCNIPVNPTGMQNVDVPRVNGIWYEYGVSFDQVGWNIMKNGTIRGVWPGEIGQQKYAATWWINFYQPVDPGRNTSNDAMKCAALWHHGNMTSQGKRYAVSVYFDSTSALANITTTILYTDYDTVEIVAGCDDYPVPADNICRQPLFWVFTRVKSPLLTPTQRQFVNSAIERYLAPFCLTMRDIRFSGFDVNMRNLPSCNIAQGTPGPFPRHFQVTMPNPVNRNPL
ncbi:uncharacterized protein LOC129601920 [Paramacrobiotus metropolitanus]|uniref:uncharacterized protein LOC129601920 n=1 Tax=Paramacrobiotus metropolitanus TaxID=2943436 RepID=UPI0024456A6C|nr:uncharacterized protein LOC129601920 [Paramacrobiotus metropolitanus]